MIYVQRFRTQERIILSSGLPPWLTNALQTVKSLRYISLDQHHLAYDQQEHNQSAYGRAWSGNLRRIASKNPNFGAVLCRAKDPALKPDKFSTSHYRVILLDGKRDFSII